MGVGNMLVVFIDANVLGGNSLTGRKSQVRNERNGCDEGSEDVEDALGLEAVSGDPSIIWGKSGVCTSGARAAKE